MRPLSLRLTAFGPFAGHEEVRLPELGPLFLIHGPTGAGKTSILDGLMFALYGQSSGAERRADQLRSHHAPPDVLTSVELVFELGGRRLAIERSPEQERPKKRGTGTVIQEHEVQLWELTNGDRRPLASGPRAVDPAVSELLGFSADQFRQVVLLPQGRFRELLTASSSEREAILERLFPVAEHQRLQDRLREQASNLAAQLKDLHLQVGTLLEHHQVETTAKLEEAITAARRTVDEAAAHQARAEESERAAQRRADDGRRRSALLTEVAAAQDALTGAQEESENAAAIERLLVAARKALQTAPAVSAWRRASERLAEAEETARRLEGEAAAAGNHLETARHQLATERARETERSDLQGRIVLLRQLLPRIKELSEARRIHGRAAEEEQALAAAAEKARGEVADLETERSGLHEQLDEARRVAAGLPELDAAVRSSRQLIKTLQRLAEFKESLHIERSKLGELQAHRNELELQLEQARESLEAFREAEHLHHAWLLAEGLTQGSPCPVCGSVHHPAPAPKPEGAPDAEAVNSVQDEIGKLEQGWRSAVAQTAGAEERTNQRNQEVIRLEEDLRRPTPSLEEAATALVAAEKRLRKAQTTLADIAELEAAAEEIGKRIEAAAGSHQKAAGRHRAAREALAAAAARRATLEDHVQEPHREAGSVEREIEEASAALQEFTVALEQARDHVTVAEGAASAARALADDAAEKLELTRQKEQATLAERDAALKRAGFSSLDEWNEAHADEEQMEEWGRIIKEADRSLSAAQGRFERAQAAALGVEAPDLEKLDRHLDEARRTADQTRDSRTRAEARLEQLQATRKDILRLEEQAGEGERLQRLAGRLADVASGRNPAGVSFRRWALGVFLDQVLASANQRFDRMSGGRYRLLRQEDATDRRRAGGLDLGVFDNFTGRERPATTLSGGESFLAALALALGLSDVVQAAAGGIRLDTLFVDEGFGSLDPEALDQALAVLDALREGGRQVGIISHVPELRDRLAQRLEVVPGRYGSTLRLPGRG